MAERSFFCIKLIFWGADELWLREWNSIRSKEVCVCTQIIFIIYSAYLPLYSLPVVDVYDLHWTSCLSAVSFICAMCTHTCDNLRVSIILQYVSHFYTELRSSRDVLKDFTEIMPSPDKSGECVASFPEVLLHFFFPWLMSCVFWSLQERCMTHSKTQVEMWVMHVHVHMLLSCHS